MYGTSSVMDMVLKHQTSFKHFEVDSEKFCLTISDNNNNIKSRRTKQIILFDIQTSITAKNKVTNPIKKIFSKIFGRKKTVVESGPVPVTISNQQTFYHSLFKKIKFDLNIPDLSVFSEIKPKVIELRQAVGKSYCRVT